MIGVKDFKEGKYHYLMSYGTEGHCQLEPSVKNLVQSRSQRMGSRHEMTLKHDIVSRQWRDSRQKTRPTTELALEQKTA